MISRLLRSLPVRVAVVGLLGVLVVLVGALAASWRVAAVGFAVTAASLLGSMLLLARGVHRTQRATASLGGDRGGSGSLSDELSLTQTLHDVFERRDVVARLDERLLEREHVERAELAALIRLVTLHDTVPPVPVPGPLTATQAFAVTDGIARSGARRVLLAGAGTSALWAVRALRQGGAVADLVCSEDDAPALRALVEARGAGDVLRVVAAAEAVPDVPYAVRPWFVLPDAADHDLVLVAASSALEARAALPALPLLLARLAPGGTVLVVEDADHPVLGPAWSASAGVVADAAWTGCGPAVALRAAPPAGSPDATSDPAAAVGSPEDAAR